MKIEMKFWISVFEEKSYTRVFKQPSFPKLDYVYKKGIKSDPLEYQGK